MAWYKIFYDEHYLKKYATGLTNERTQREVDFIKAGMRFQMVQLPSLNEITIS